MRKDEKKTMNRLPALTPKGFLPEGVHRCSGDEFIQRFCLANENRKQLWKAFADILDFAKTRNALCVLIGGSYVTDKEAPNDLDVVIVLRSKEHIPSRTERLILDGKRTDIMFCSNDEPEIIGAFVRLLSYSRYSESVGLVQIDLNHPDHPWQIVQETDDETYEIIKRAYFNRHLVDLNKPAGVLVTVHGLISHAAWNSKVIPIASSQGWVVAPYIYGYTTPEILMSESKRKSAVNAFRDWVYQIKNEYCTDGQNISVIAHSFGTYLVGAYMHGFNEFAPVSFNSIILTGSILNESYNWDACAGFKVARVRNEIAPNDTWVDWMPRKPPEWLGLDPLFGKAGVKGFTSTSRILTQHENRIFDHNNVIEKDVIASMWMPYLNSNRYASEEEGYRRITEKFSQEVDE